MRGLPILVVIGLLGMLLPGPHPAWAEARVQIENKATGLYIQAEIDTTADRATAWTVLTDYNHWADFVPDLLVSRVISNPGDPLVIEQRGRIPSMPNFPVVMILQAEETPQTGIRFYRTAGNVQSFAGEWKIEGKTQRVRLVYRAVLMPGFPMPPQVSEEIFRNDAKIRLEAMAEEMAKRMPKPAPRPSPRTKRSAKKKRK